MRNQGSRRRKALMMPERRIAIISVYYGPDKSPSVMGAVKLFTERGFKVDLLVTPRPDDPASHFDGDWVRVCPMPRRPARGLLRAVPEHLYLPVATARRLWDHDYAAIVAVETAGLIGASLFCLLRRVPMAYYSMELGWYWIDKPTLLPYVLDKWFLVPFLSRRAALTIVQDGDRAGWLMRHQGIDRERIVIVPHAPLGKASRVRDDYLRKKLGIDPSQSIVLYAGGIGSDYLCFELAQAAELWPENLVLVIHAARIYEADCLTSIREVAARTDRVRLSLEPVPYDEVDRIYASADVTVALYHPGNDNLSLIAAASGKLAHSLMVGVPVVVSDLPSLRRVVTEYRCGECVCDAGQVAAAVRTILTRYDTYATNAVRCFDERYDFGRFFEPVLEWVETAAMAGAAGVK